MSAANPALNAPLAQRPSGIVVPAHLASLPEEPEARPEGKAAEGARDPDGRRRVVLTKETRKLFGRLAGDLGRDDFGIILWCKTSRARTEIVKDAVTGAPIAVELTEQIPGACGEIMLREGEGEHDPGFGCKCTRIHFLQNTAGLR